MNRYELLHGDCLEKLKGLPDNSVDAVVTDPPYELAFMGRKWDASGIAYSIDLWREVLRVLKPGGHLLAFGGTRTYHRMTCAIEDAGFEVRDSIHWVYGSGFPKGLDVSKAIDKAKGAERLVVGKGKAGALSGNSKFNDAPVGTITRDQENPTQGYKCGDFGEYDITAPATPEARQWSGWNVALKPAHEPIVVARKPLIGTVAENVLAHGTGALNVDGCRVGADTIQTNRYTPGKDMTAFNGSRSGEPYVSSTHTGRWPPNMLFSHLPECGDSNCADGCAVRELDEQSGIVGNGWKKNYGEESYKGRQYGGGSFGGGGYLGGSTYADSGGASRFFPVFRYQAKAPPKERKVEGVTGQHPTQKPEALMKWLVRLVTPPNGLVLDPFTGSGTTGVAALLEGFRFIGCEREDEYFAIATARLEHALKEQPVKKEKQATLFDLEAP